MRGTHVEDTSSLRPIALLALFCLAHCGGLRGGEERALLDLEVGQETVGGATFRVQGGLASIRKLEPGRLELWAQAPVLRIQVTLGGDAQESWQVKVHNAMPDAVLQARTTAGADLFVSGPKSAWRTTREWKVQLKKGSSAWLTVAPPDAGQPQKWRFAVLSDTQDTWETLRRFIARMNQDSTIRFVVSTGDLRSGGDRDGLVRYQKELQGLNVPFFTTVGNHEIDPDTPEDWHELFGRHSYNFAFKDVHFSLVDSASATIDSLVYGWLDQWTEAGQKRVHVFLTHYPPLDPVGSRNAAFRSRKEAAKLLAKLARGEVDLTLYGHIHSYYAFSNAGIPAYISGGGTHQQEKLDGIGYHYLTVDVTSNSRIERVSLVRLD